MVIASVMNELVLTPTMFTSFSILVHTDSKPYDALVPRYYLSNDINGHKKVVDAKRREHMTQKRTRSDGGDFISRKIH